MKPVALLSMLLLATACDPPKPTAPPVDPPAKAPAAAPRARVAPKAPALPDAKEKVVRGLTLHLEAGGVSDSRAVRLAALYVPSETPASPFLPPGPFKARFEGFVEVDIGTDCVFEAKGTGSFTLEINGKPALESMGKESKAIRLKKGNNRLVGRYEPPAEGDAVFRLYWKSATLEVDGDWTWEPILPVVLWHDRNEAALRETRRRREGRELVATRRCTRCHAVKGGAMPELEMDAPSLADAGARLKSAFIASWLRNPQEWIHDARMPKLAGVSDQDIGDLVAFLATLGKPAESRKPSKETVTEGGQLFAELRCIGCHTRPDREPAEGRRPLRHVNAKWRPAALRAFLKQPDRHFKWIRMPNFKLTDAEADRLAAFLLARAPMIKLQGAPAGDAARGKERFAALGCAACHDAGVKSTRTVPALSALPADGWTRGCKAADYAFTDAQKTAIVAFAATDLSSFTRSCPSEFAERQIKALRCQACHKRDKTFDFWSDVQDETEDLLVKEENPDEDVPEAPIQPVVPSLTWIGEKLHPEWTASFIAGDLPYRPRPWLPVRMPAFRSRAAALAAGLAYSHGRPAKSEPAPPPDPKLAEIGRNLAGRQPPSLACIQCHAVGTFKAVGVFEAPGPNFANVRARIQREYFDRWMFEPIRVEPGTKMPTFATRGRSQLFEVLDGDGPKQYEAIWNWLMEGEKIRKPDQ